MAKSKKILPTEKEVLDFIHSSTHDLSKREIAKAFNIKGDLREPFKAILKKIESNGLWKKNTRKVKQTNFKTAKNLETIFGRKKSVLTCNVIEIIGPNKYHLIPSEIKNFKEVIILTFNDSTLRPGQRILVNVKRLSDGTLNATFIKALQHQVNHSIGVFEPHKNGGYVYPVSKKQKKEFYIPDRHTLNAVEGDIVKIEIIEGKTNQNHGKIVQILGNVYKPKGLSLISILQHGLPDEFSKNAIEEAAKGTIPLLGKREDLRDYDLVTIDGDDARDFDDAVFAEPVENGWHILVAIADVAHYVKAGSALDQEALARGNSVYFPDQVLPMLPEKLSNDLCSLRPNQDRACMAVHILLDQSGHITDYKFVRGLMRSKARLTYTEAQHIYEGTVKSPLLPVIRHMYEIYEILLERRYQRGALEIGLPEHQIILDQEGNLENIRVRDRLDSHKLIEEFMILANICAAKALEVKKVPSLYRVHESPSESRVQALRNFLTLIKLMDKKTTLTTPKDFNHVLYKVKNTHQHTMVSEMVLRSQQQAVYSPSNHGHFGLGLTHYSHFTSPIRRYADLIVHRSLIKAFNLGEDGLSQDEVQNLGTTATHITEREKEAEAAEREVISRYLSLYVLESGQVNFSARITSVTSFGMFVQVDEMGISGMIPISSLPDFFIYNESSHELKGRSTQTVYTLGQNINVSLHDVNVLTGEITFHIANVRNQQKKQPNKKIN